MNLSSAENGYKYVLKNLKIKEGYCWNNIIGTNFGNNGDPRYYIIIGDSGSDNILIKFTREPYKSGDGGFRETINDRTGMKHAVKCNVKRIFWIYPNGSIYWMKLNKFQEKTDRRTTLNESVIIWTILMKELERY